MGAVRRLDSYSDPTWQPLFITSGVGVLVISAGVGLFLIQLAYSVWKRRELRDATGDPWDGRTLEWSVPSPAPHYNFAVQPVVTERDDWWYRKQRGETTVERRDYVDIWLPKNGATGVVIGAAAGVFGFAVIWHLWWLVVIAVIFVIVTIIRRTLDDESEYQVSATELFHDVAKRQKAGAS